MIFFWKGVSLFLLLEERKGKYKLVLLLLPH